MDRSFLSNEAVVKASRDFVCVRLATYEDTEESKYLTELYGRTLANTVVVMLAADGKTKLTRADRRPSFRSGSQMAQWMNELVDEEYADAPEDRWQDSVVPEVKSLDLCLNVASCDGLPVLVAIGATDEELAEKRKQVLPIAWNEDLAGQVLFASAKSDDDLRGISGLDKRKTGIYLVEPDPYGLSANVLMKFGPDEEQNFKNIRDALAAFKAPRKSQSAHKSLAVQMGFRWHTETPVTDQQFVRATERIWGEEYKHTPPKKQKQDD